MKRTMKIAEVCKQLDLPPYVLRYWETEFSALGAGAKAGGAARVYSAEDLAVLRRIKQLLYEEGYTIAGARKKLESEPAPRPERATPGPLFHAEAGEAAPDPEPPAAAAAGDARALDSPADERIESLRRGVAEALKEARALLAALEKQGK